jgi:uncharacterized phage protein gp47/JayE
MPWSTPSLDDVRKQNRDYITARLHSAAMVPNSVLRVLSDGNAGLAYLVLLYIDWLALQLLPDTAETEWLDRHAAIWLPGNGRKAATFASGSVTATGINGSILPQGSQLTGATASGGVLYETLAQITVGSDPTPVDVRAVDPGIAGNLDEGSSLAFVNAIAGVDGTVTVVEMDGGVDVESDDELRERVLERIQQPPMGGAEYDYVAWAKQVPGVTRAWAAGEQGVGTITVRFLMDDLRADDDGWPTPDDIIAVNTYIEQKRPVTVKDCYVLAPIKQFLDLTITDLAIDDAATRAAIEQSIRAMLFARAAPGQTIFRSWMDEAISNAVGEDHHNLIFDDAVMPAPGYMAVLETIYYA